MDMPYRQAELFTPTDPPHVPDGIDVPGLVDLLDFITPEEHDSLLAEIDQKRGFRT